MSRINAVFARFGKGALAGAIGQMALVSMQTPEVWKDFYVLLNSLAMAGVFGAIVGLLLALQKWASWEE